MKSYSLWTAKKNRKLRSGLGSEVRVRLETLRPLSHLRFSRTFFARAFDVQNLHCTLTHCNQWLFSDFHFFHAHTCGFINARLNLSMLYFCKSRV
ncbi:hypothetical protein GDO81_023165 [Engystomops pustulosus]|uniref:Uncharacterized protein n=1 Tax=Engystomops pustulosus TaxID=76066 RepID=A0AAV6Z382_ENGPU|nr:hypothetical protein GDO81_023165 [Engystomops pustulosus]